MKCIAIAFVVLLSMAALQGRAATQIVVTATGTYPADVDAVQNAVDTNDIVTLRGTFNFGQAGYSIDFDTFETTGTPVGMVTITRPNVVLQADKATGATILGGGAPTDLEVLYYYFIWPAIVVHAPGVTIRGLTMEGVATTGIFISSAFSTQSTGNTITIEDNKITALTSPIWTEFRGGWPLLIRRNNIESLRAGSIWELCSGLTLDETGTFVQRMSMLDIVDNNIIANSSGQDLNPYGKDGISVEGWPVNFFPLNLPLGTNPADWGENGPVIIARNTLIMHEHSGNGISLGGGYAGLNHSLATGNTILGIAHGGIWKYPYGHDNWIIDNDLSGLKVSPQYASYSSHISVQAGNTTVTRNILGTVKGPSAVPMMVWSINHFPTMDPTWGVVTPMPLPTENCTIADNDYRGSNCPGWSEGMGCILLASEVDLQAATGVGTEVRNNVIKETGNFPKGTGGPKQQIYELKVGPSPLVHDNRIVGLPANSIPNPGVGR
jgi:hypothetical protein